MLRSSTQLAKSHGDDLGLEYLWNGDEYSLPKVRLEHATPGSQTQCSSH